MMNDRQPPLQTGKRLAIDDELHGLQHPKMGCTLVRESCYCFSSPAPCPARLSIGNVRSSGLLQR